MNYVYGSAGSVVLECPICQREHFRQRGEWAGDPYHADKEFCVFCGTYPLTLLREKDGTQMAPLSVGQIIHIARNAALQASNDPQKAMGTMRKLAEVLEAEGILVHLIIQTDGAIHDVNGYASEAACEAAFKKAGGVDPNVALAHGLESEDLPDIQIRLDVLVK